MFVKVGGAHGRERRDALGLATVNLCKMDARAPASGDKHFYSLYFTLLSASAHAFGGSRTVWCNEKKSGVWSLKSEVKSRKHLALTLDSRLYTPDFFPFIV